MDSILNRNRDRLRSVLVTLLCAAGASASTLMLLDDLRGGASQGKGEVLASLERQEEKVRVRHAGSFVWNQLGQADPLFKKDSVQTGDGSGAAVRLKDGTLLEIGENSLIVVDELSELSLNFGQIVVRKANGEDQQISVDRSGKKKVEALSIRLVGPENFGRLFLEQDQTAMNLSFNYQTSSVPEGATGPAAVQIARDKRFTGKVLSVKVDSSASKEGRATTKIPPGRYFWRVVSADGKALSALGQFRVAYAQMLRPIAPHEQAPVVIWNDTGAVQFRWANPLGEVKDPSSAPEPADFTASTHELEVALDERFTRGSQKQSVPALAGMATWGSLAPGRYYWRLISQYGKIRTVSRPLSFSVEAGKRLPVRLAFPLADATAEKIPQQRFAWATDALEGAQYRVELKGPAGVTTSDLMSEKSWLRSGLSSGSYSWRVLALTRGDVVGESEWRKLTVVEGKPIALRTPTLNQLMGHWGKGAEFTFAWEKDPVIAREAQAQYVLEISTSDRFSEPGKVQKVLREESLAASTLRLVDGTYHWRVKLLGADGQEIKVSAPRSFTVGMHPPLRAPASIQTVPQPGAIANYQETPGGPIARWPKVEGARAYELKLFRKEPNGRVSSQPLAVKKTEETQYAFGNLSEGSYVWTVRAIDEIGRPGEALDPRSLQVTYGQVLRAPKIKTREIQ